jgi:hypothetical protein
LSRTRTRDRNTAARSFDSHGPEHRNRDLQRLRSFRNHARVTAALLAAHGRDAGAIWSIDAVHLAYL